MKHSYFFVSLFFCFPRALQGGLEPEETLRDASYLEFYHGGGPFSGRCCKPGLCSQLGPCTVTVAVLHAPGLSPPNLPVDFSFGALQSSPLALCFL